MPLHPTDAMYVAGGAILSVRRNVRLCFENTALVGRPNSFHKEGLEIPLPIPTSIVPSEEQANVPVPYQLSERGLNISIHGSGNESLSADFTASRDR